MYTPAIDADAIRDYLVRFTNKVQELWTSSAEVQCSALSER